MRLPDQTYLASEFHFSRRKNQGNPRDMDKNHPSNRGDRKATRNAALWVGH